MLGTGSTSPLLPHPTIGSIVVAKPSSLTRGFLKVSRPMIFVIGHGWIRYTYGFKHNT